MDRNLELTASEYKARGFIMPLKIAFETLFYLSLFCWILSFSQFDKIGLVMFLPLIVFLALYFRKTRLHEKISQASFTGILTIIYILIFDKIDNTNITKYIHLAILDRISIPTLFLSVTMLVYLVRIMFSRSYVLKISSLGKKIGSAFFVILINAMLLCFMLYVQHQTNVQTDVQLLNKIIKYSMIILLFQECITDVSLTNRLSWGLIISMSAILMLNIVF